MSIIDRFFRHLGKHETICKVAGNIKEQKKCPGHFPSAMSCFIGTGRCSFLYYEYLCNYQGDFYEHNK